MYEMKQQHGERRETELIQAEHEAAVFLKCSRGGNLMLQVRAWRTYRRDQRNRFINRWTLNNKMTIWLHISMYFYTSCIKWAELLLQLSPAAESSSLSVSFVISWFSNDQTSPVVTEADRIWSVPGWDSVCASSAWHGSMREAGLRSGWHEVKRT